MRVTPKIIAINLIGKFGCCSSHRFHFDINRIVLIYDYITPVRTPVSLHDNMPTTSHFSDWICVAALLLYLIFSIQIPAIHLAKCNLSRPIGYSYISAKQVTIVLYTSVIHVLTNLGPIHFKHRCAIYNVKRD